MAFKPQGFTLAAVKYEAARSYPEGSKTRQVAEETAEAAMSFSHSLPISAWAGKGWFHGQPPRSIKAAAIRHVRAQRRRKVGFIVETFVWLLFYAIIIKILVEILWWLFSTPGARALTSNGG